jgi:hypothetical protein
VKDTALYILLPNVHPCGIVKDNALYILLQNVHPYGIMEDNAMYLLPKVHPYGIMEDNDYAFFSQTFIPTGFFGDGVHQYDSAAFVRRNHRIADAVECGVEDLFERIFFVICFVRHCNISVPRLGQRSESTRR